MMPDERNHRTLSLGAVQFAHRGGAAANLDRAEELIRDAAGRGARIILTPELLESDYFCRTERPENFRLAVEAGRGPGWHRFSALAAELGVVLPYSFFERANQAHFNSLAIFDADGTCLGVYRKSHIPDGPGYEEKFYFNGGDTGFRVFDTAHGRIGAAICWDQWFPETARILALQGAECLLYPTAIGSEPEEPGLDSMPHWRRVMQGHGGANLLPVVAANRYGTESSGTDALHFYGSSFITDQWGEIVESAPRDADAVLVRTFHREELRLNRANWGFFRDRRPDLYQSLLTLEGARNPAP